VLRPRVLRAQYDRHGFHIAHEEMVRPRAHHIAIACEKLVRHDVLAPPKRRPGSPEARDPREARAGNAGERVERREAVERERYAKGGEVEREREEEGRVKSEREQNRE
jgi:hypothetical protein